MSQPFRAPLSPATAVQPEANATLAGGSEVSGAPGAVGIGDSIGVGVAVLGNLGENRPPQGVDWFTQIALTAAANVKTCKSCTMPTNI